LIEASHLSHRFGAVRAIEDVTFRVARGEIVGFLGPNGAGKTTTLRILAGIFPPSAGRARIAGFDTQEQSLAVRGRLGYFAESAPYYPELSVVAYLGYVARLKGIRSGARESAVDGAMARCDLHAVADRRAGTLSRGYRQRLGLAQALLGDPEVLLLDEPTVGLDPEQAAGIRERIGAMRGERTILLSSHNLAEVQSLCDRLLVLRQGRLIADDTPQGLAARLRPELCASFRVEARADDVVRVVGAVGGVTRAVADADGRVRVEARSEEALREVSRAIQDQGWLLLEIHRDAPALEEIFLSLVGPGAERPR
jgi:ABC-2 type transport system ATP-binding protein